MKLTKEIQKEFIKVMIYVILGFIGGFILCFLITNNYLESAKIYMMECQNQTPILIKNTFEVMK